MRTHNSSYEAGGRERAYTAIKYYVGMLGPLLLTSTKPTFLWRRKKKSGRKKNWIARVESSFPRVVTKEA